MARMSNKDRIQHAAAEAAAAAEQKAAKKTAKKPTKKATKRASKPAAKGARMKVVWAIINSQGKPIETFAYPDKAAATSEAQRLSSSTGRPHELRATKVPMD